jgi:hypothetical protein
MLRFALLALLLPACVASTLVGASTTTALALGTSAAQRHAGGCYAVCSGGTSCNPRSGLCERMPCDGQCAAGQHCESTATQSFCAPGPPSDVLSSAPGTQKTVPWLPPPPPVPSGPPQIVPAAEQHPPTDK